MRIPLAFALVAGLFGAALALAPAAQAAPDASFLPPSEVVLGGMNVGVGFGIAVPVGHSHRHPGPYARPAHRTAWYGGAWYPAPAYVPTGHWEYRQERVWVPGVLLGYDVHGYPVYSAGTWTLQTTRVWVPDPVPHVRSPRPHVRVGFGTYFR